MKMFQALVVACVATVYVSAGRTLQAAPIVVGTSSPTVFAVPTADTNLLNLATASFTGSIRDEDGVGTSGTLAPLTDGAFGNIGTVPQATLIHSNTIITYSFATPIDITAINTYTGWGDDGRTNQDYSITFARSSAPGVFNALTSVNYDVTVVQPSNGFVAITDSTGTLATDVSSLVFSFPSVQNGFVGYRELSVQGVSAAVVPEVGTGAFALLGAAVSVVGLVVRRKH